MRKELSAIEKQQLDCMRAALGANLDSRAKFALLAFWARHPSGWSSRRIVAPHSRVARAELYRALNDLVDAGVVEAREDPGICFYALRTQHPAYAAVLQLGKLGPKRRRYLLRAVDEDSSPLAAELAS